MKFTYWVHSSFSVTHGEAVMYNTDERFAKSGIELRLMVIGETFSYN
jgi:hypothetical protein